VHWRPDRRCLYEQHRRDGSLVFSDGPVILLVQRSVPDASNLGVVCYVNILGRSSGDVERSVEPLYLLEAVRDVCPVNRWYWPGLGGGVA
jgi:hypothetical protein